MRSKITSSGPTMIPYFVFNFSNLYCSVVYKYRPEIDHAIPQQQEITLVFFQLAKERRKSEALAFLQKKLNKTDTTEKLTVPSEWLGNILPYPARVQDKVQFKVSLINLNDKSTIKSYPFALSTHSTGYLKPVLQSRSGLSL